MEDFAKLFAALASLAWPALFAVLLFKLFGPISKLVESASGRKFTLKVAGNELSMEEASEQQRKSIDDLQFKLAELQRLLAGGPTASLQPAPQRAPMARGAATGAPLVPAAPATEARRILWVDDQPRNNSYLIASLQERGVRVDTVVSTDEALARLGRQGYDIVISDMARPEASKPASTWRAGCRGARRRCRSTSSAAPVPPSICEPRRWRPAWPRSPRRAPAC